MSRVIGVIGVVVLLVVVAFSFRWLWPSTATANATVRESIRTVRIDNDSGNVRIRAGVAGNPSVRQRFTWGRFLGKRPEAAHRIEGDRLVLAGCGWNCSVDYDVTVPRGTTVTGHVDSGDLSVDGAAAVDVSDNSGTVRVRNVPGTVKADVDSGDIELRGIGRDITVNNNSGNILGQGLRGRVNANVDSGSIRLTLDAAQDVHAVVNSGDIALTMPNDRYRVQGTTDSGSRDIRVPTDPAGSHLLNLSTDSGSVTVTPAAA
jgi:hypothetical protein